MFSPIICHRIMCPVRKRYVGLKIGARTPRRAYFAEIRRATCRLSAVNIGEILVAYIGFDGKTKKMRTVVTETATWTRLFRFACRKNACIRDEA